MQQYVRLSARAEACRHCAPRQHASGNLSGRPLLFSRIRGSIKQAATAPAGINTDGRKVHDNRAVAAAFDAVTVAAASACILLSAPSYHALAAEAPPSNDPQRCTVQALKKFADTRARFSQEASGGKRRYLFLRSLLLSSS